MNTPKEFLDSLNIKSDYDNFSEEVQIDKETSAGSMTLYTVTNKNDVTFQRVPGQPGLKDRGFMGFINGDRARPIMLSGSVRITKTASTNNTTTILINESGQVDITPSVGWDIELTADAGGAGTDTKTETAFIVVG